MAKKIEKALVFKLPKIIKPYVTNNQTMCSFTGNLWVMLFLKLTSLSVKLSIQDLKLINRVIL